MLHAFINDGCSFAKKLKVSRNQSILRENEKKLQYDAVLFGNEFSLPCRGSQKTESVHDIVKGHHQVCQQKTMGPPGEQRKPSEKVQGSSYPRYNHRGAAAK